MWTWHLGILWQQFSKKKMFGLKFGLIRRSHQTGDIPYQKPRLISKSQNWKRKDYTDYTAQHRLHSQGFTEAVPTVNSFRLIFANQKNENCVWLTKRKEKTLTWSQSSRSLKKKLVSATVKMRSSIFWPNMCKCWPSFTYLNGKWISEFVNRIKFLISQYTCIIQYLDTSQCSLVYDMCPFFQQLLHPYWT